MLESYNILLSRTDIKQRSSLDILQYLKLLINIKNLRTLSIQHAEGSDTSFLSKYFDVNRCSSGWFGIQNSDLHRTPNCTVFYPSNKILLSPVDLCLLDLLLNNGDAHETNKTKLKIGSGEIYFSLDHLIKSIVQREVDENNHSCYELMKQFIGREVQTDPEWTLSYTAYIQTNITKMLTDREELINSYLGSPLRRSFSNLTSDTWSQELFKMEYSFLFTDKCEVIKSEISSFTDMYFLYLNKKRDRIILLRNDLLDFLDHNMPVMNRIQKRALIENEHYNMIQNDVSYEAYNLKQIVLLKERMQQDCIESLNMLLAQITTKVMNMTSDAIENTNNFNQHITLWIFAPKELTCSQLLKFTSSQVVDQLLQDRLELIIKQLSAHSYHQAKASSLVKTLTSNSKTKYHLLLTRMQKLLRSLGRQFISNLKLDLDSHIAQTHLIDTSNFLDHIHANAYISVLLAHIKSNMMRNLLHDNLYKRLLSTLPLYDPFDYSAQNRTKIKNKKLVKDFKYFSSNSLMTSSDVLVSVHIFEKTYKTPISNIDKYPIAENVLMNLEPISSLEDCMLFFLCGCFESLQGITQIEYKQLHDYVCLKLLYNKTVDYKRSVLHRMMIDALQIRKISPSIVGYDAADIAEDLTSMTHPKYVNLLLDRFLPWMLMEQLHGKNHSLQLKDFNATRKMWTKCLLGQDYIEGSKLSKSIGRDDHITTLWLIFSDHWSSFKTRRKEIYEIIQALRWEPNFKEKILEFLIHILHTQ
ncbi:hypothetical protein AKO1_001819 [Acrasis kona]|uniref:Uncharacterized protein n=1 Tax=Acrasis kona TaxID=1008807 RepID=A0AAW2Z9Q8_9EUKA